MLQANDATMQHARFSTPMSNVSPATAKIVCKLQAVAGEGHLLLGWLADSTVDDPRSYRVSGAPTCKTHYTVTFVAGFGCMGVRMQAETHMQDKIFKDIIRVCL